MKYVYPVTLSPEADGTYSVWVEDLLGCATQGNDLADAIDAVKDAMEGWLYGAEKQGEAIPIPTPAASIPLEPGEFVSFVVADTDVYRRIVESFSVRKNLTIPSWLAEKADAANVNYSQILQEGLIARLGE